MLASASQVCAVLDHDRVKVGWVLKAKDNTIQRIARIAIIFPKDGAGRLTVAVSDFSADGETRSYIGKAGGDVRQAFDVSAATRFTGPIRLMRFAM